MNPRKLPDDALTVCCATGMSALCDRVADGLLDEGIYECPVCGGSGRVEANWERDGLAGTECRVCTGTGAVHVEARGWWAATPEEGDPWWTESDYGRWATRHGGGPGDQRPT